MRTILVNGDGLALDDVVDVARQRARAELGPDVPRRMAAARRVVTDAVERGAVVYGVITGFGALADVSVAREDLEAMQLALVRSHAAGTGEPLPADAVRALLLLRATIAAGASGCRPDLPERLLELLDRDLLPTVPAKGSVGASATWPSSPRSRCRWSARACWTAGRRPPCSPPRDSPRWCSPRRRGSR